MWLTGRHFSREEIAEEALQLALSWEIDTAPIRGKDLDPLVSKIKVQKTLSLHMADYIMTRRMNNGSTALRVEIWL